MPPLSYIGKLFYHAVFLFVKGKWAFSGEFSPIFLYSGSVLAVPALFCPLSPREKPPRCTRSPPPDAKELPPYRRMQNGFPLPRGPLYKPMSPTAMPTGSLPAACPTRPASGVLYKVSGVFIKQAPDAAFASGACSFAVIPPARGAAHIHRRWHGRCSPRPHPCTPSWAPPPRS